MRERDTDEKLEKRGQKQRDRDKQVKGTREKLRNSRREIQRKKVIQKAGIIQRERESEGDTDRQVRSKDRFPAKCGPPPASLSQLQMHLI